MGREIRRVPPDWEHPRYTAENARRPEWVGSEIPIYDNDYETAAEEWIADLLEWRDSPDRKPGCYFWEVESNPPDPERYRKRKWTPEEATHVQVYETVSEGTPVTPHFATKAELVDYLVAYGDFWDQRRGDGGWERQNAEQFVESEWACSLVVINTPEKQEILAPRDGQP